MFTKFFNNDSFNKLSAKAESFLQGQLEPKSPAHDTLAEISAYLADDSQVPLHRAQLKLERLVQNDTVIVDACAILHKDFPLFAEHLMEELRKSGKQAWVPSYVLRELRNVGTMKSECLENARTACAILQSMEAQGLLRIADGGQATLADQEILTLVNQCRTQSSVLVITRDKGLCRDLQHLNELNSVQGHSIHVCLVNSHGYLSNFHPDYIQDQTQEQAPRSQEDTRRIPAEETIAQTVAPRFQPQQLICQDCGKPFWFTEKDAAYYAQQGWTVLPKRCKPCRAARKQTTYHAPGQLAQL